MTTATPPSAQSLRRSEIDRHIDSRTAAILEIGALDSPTYSAPEYNVSYVDYATREELAKKGEKNPRYKYDRLVDVTYPICGQRYSNIIEERFDLIIANHVIEHVPDMIGWLQDLGLMLTRKGLVFLSIPDKRYTFDIARRDTNFFDLLRAHLSQQKQPDFINVLEHFWSHKNIKAMDIWSGRSVDLTKMRFSPDEAFQQTEHAISSGYADVHCHVFQAPTFRPLIELIRDFGFLGFQSIHIGDVPFGRNEFHVTLSNFDPLLAKRIVKPNT